MGKRGWAMRVCLAAGVAAAGAASCNGADHGSTEGHCYTEYSEPGDVHASGTQTMPDGTEHQVGASESDFTMRQGYDYVLYFNDEMIEYDLSFSTSTEDGEPFDMQYGELCMHWMPGDGSQLPPCATVDGDQGCPLGCGPVVGFGRIQVVTDCEGDTRTYDQICFEYADGEVTLLGDVTGQFWGTVRFSIVTRLEQTWCSSGDWDDLASGCSKR